jgi:hypothetical protein
MEVRKLSFRGSLDSLWLDLIEESAMDACIFITQLMAFYNRSALHLRIFRLEGYIVHMAFRRAPCILDINWHQLVSVLVQML